MIFIIGMAINIHSDYILRNLRKSGEVVYKIPKGAYVQYNVMQHLPPDL